MKVYGFVNSSTIDVYSALLLCEQFHKDQREGDLRKHIMFTRATVRNDFLLHIPFFVNIFYENITATKKIWLVSLYCFPRHCLLIQEQT